MHPSLSFLCTVHRRDEIIDYYRAVLERCSVHHPEAYRALVHSKSNDCDERAGHVLDLWKADNLPVRDLERDVRYMAMCEWDAAFPDAAQEGLSGPHMWHLLSQDDPEESVLISNRMKRERAIPLARRACPTGSLCNVLTCTDEATRTMNSLGYCDRHWGLALFHALRHSYTGRCQACPLWDVMGLKITMDSGHLFFYSKTMHVVQDVDMGTVTVYLTVFRRPIPPRPPSRSQSRAGWSANIVREKTTFEPMPTHYIDRRGRARLTPPFSMVTRDIALETVLYWEHMRYLDPDTLEIRVVESEDEFARLKKQISPLMHWVRHAGK